MTRVGLFRVSMTFLTALAVFLLLISAAGFAETEKIHVCGPCSGWFIEEAKTVVEEMKLDDRLEVVRSSCMGTCGEPAVISFRDVVYWGMDQEKLRNMLESIFPFPTG